MINSAIQRNNESAKDDLNGIKKKRGLSIYANVI